MLGSSPSPPTSARWAGQGSGQAVTVNQHQPGLWIQGHDAALHAAQGCAENVVTLNFIQSHRLDMPCQARFLNRYKQVFTLSCAEPF